MDDYDFYDYEKVQKLQNERARKYMDLVRKWHDAKEKGDEEAMKKAAKAMLKHKDADKVLKEKAEKAGYYWY